jgi:hypothetical protein
MPDEAKKSNVDFRGDLYRLIRTDTERNVNELIAALLSRREAAVDRHRRERFSNPKRGAEPTITEADLTKLIEIRMSYSTAFAHALLQGAVEVFEDQKSGLQLLKRLIEMELVEMEQDAGFLSRATSPGSTAIN